MSNEFEDYFGSAGDMASNSQNPAEQNHWLEKQQKELERQKKALERQQGSLNKPADGFTAPATGLTPAHNPETALPEIAPLKTDIPKTGLSKTEAPQPAASGALIPETGAAGDASPKIDLSIQPEDAYTTFGSAWGQQKLIGIYDKQPVPHREQPEAWRAELGRRAQRIPTLSRDVQDCLFRFHCQTNPPLSWGNRR